MVRNDGDSIRQDWAARAPRLFRWGLVLTPTILALIAALWLAAPLLQAGAVSLDSARATAFPGEPDGLTRLPHAREPTPPANRPGAFATTGARQIAFSFDRADVPDGDLAVFAPRGGEGRILTNRVPRPSIAASNTPSPVLLDQGAIAVFPRSFLHPGLNRVDLVTEAPLARAWPNGLLFGPAAPLQRAQARQARIHDLAPRLSLVAAAAALIAALALAALQPRRRLWRPAALTGLAAAFVGLPLQAVAGVPADLVRAQADILPPAIAVVLLTLPYAPAPGQGDPALGRMALLGLVLLAAIALPLSEFPGRTAIATAGSVLLTLAAAGAAAWRARPSLTSWSQRPPAETAAALLAATWLLAVAACNSTLLPLIPSLSLEIYAATVGVVLLGGGLLVLIDRCLLAAENLWRQRRALAALVREQGATIDQQQAIIARELTQRAAFEERERLTRDIHDGIGGQLLSLLVRVRVGSIGQRELEVEIQNSINDLRLIVDSLDHAADSFPDALSVVHSRLRRQLETIGLTLVWRQDDRALPLRLTARKALDLFRILQEAFANILKHAEADRVEVDIALGPDSQGAVFTVADNGKGLTGGATDGRGRGLGNIRRRAEGLDGKVEFGPGLDGRGLAVRLTLPAEAGPAS